MDCNPRTHRAQIGFQSWWIFPWRHFYPSPLLWNFETSLSLLTGVLLSCLQKSFMWNLCCWHLGGDTTCINFITISVKLWRSVDKCEQKRHMWKVLNKFSRELVLHQITVEGRSYCIFHQGKACAGEKLLLALWEKLLQDYICLVQFMIFLMKSESEIK